MRLFSVPRLCCPSCATPVVKLSRKPDGADFVAYLLADLPFWLVFGLCVAIGMVDWLAGIFAFAALPFAYILWDRARSRFECNSCGKRFEFSETVLRSTNGV